MSTALTGLSATRLARMIRGDEVSAVEVVEAHLARIEALNPTINAVVAVAPAASTQAAERDRELRRGREIGPLHGVPFTAKDIIETADLPTTLGLPELADNRPERDATVVARMRAAGAILIGKTNCPPGGSGGDTVNDLFGRTYNPYDPKRSPGGSSGGEAAAIASGMSPCGLGSDSGGSLRMPAHFCGIATLKPTAGRIPVTGVLDDSGALGPMSDPRTQAGPMARHVEDLATLLGVLAGPDGRDAGAMPIPLGEPDTVVLRGMRATLHVLPGDAAPDAGTERALRDALASLAAAGRPRRDSAAEKLIQTLPGRLILDAKVAAEIADVSYEAARLAVLALEHADVLKPVFIGRRRNRAWETPEVVALLDYFEWELGAPTQSAQPRRAAPRRRQP